MGESVTNAKLSANKETIWHLNQSANFEGTGTGFGAIFSTATFIGGGKDGTFSECGSAFLDNGDLLNGVGQGTYESKGKHRWSTASTMQLSDGRRLASAGEIDLAARTWKGTL